MYIPYFIKIFSFPSFAVRLDGSAVHPPLRGRPSNAGAPAPSAQPAHAYICRAASEIANAKAGTLKGGVSRFIAQGLRKAVKGRLAGNPSQTDAKPIQCACGALLIKTPYPVSTSQTRASRVRHQSRSLYRGVTGHSPVRRGSARRAAASAQGKAFPTRIRHSALG
jgi:hypothetical protein